MHIFFKKLTATALAPVRATPGSSGLDLHADLGQAGASVTLNKGDTIAISTGIAIEIPYGIEGQVRGRSGLAFRDGIFAHLGTIDSDYRGKIQVLLTKQTEGAKTICHGDRIAQLVIAPVCMDKLIEVDATELSGTSRGKGGFGHTGQ